MEQFVVSLSLLHQHGVHGLVVVSGVQHGDALYVV